MNRNVGASFGLSVLIVLFFAVALYQPDRPPPPIAAVSSSPPAVPVEARAPDEPAAIAPPRPVVARPVSQRTPVREPAPEPRGPFTRVRDGETLSDIARRVYGSDDARNKLWIANRDILDHRDAPLPRGSILRTP